MFCPLEKCQWYGDASKYGRKCYYGEPMCWRGWVDSIIEVIKLRFHRI